MKQMKLFNLIFLSGALVCGSNAILTARAGETLRILPDQISLHGPNAFQRLMVVHEKDGITRGEVPVLSWESSQSAIANIYKNGTVRATGNGTATIKAVTESGEVSVVVNVTNQDEQEVWSFNRHILPVMAKAGCNQGACHGALAGKGGFRLSLRGYDPDSDHYNITREALGRRTEALSPERSLILTKPTMAVRHKGGKRLDPHSREYQILAEWIAQGATPPQAEEAELQRVEVLPPHSILRKGDVQRLIVRAHYGDGRVEDVTDWAKFTSVNETVAKVDEATGRVEVIGSGEGAVSVWFSSRVVIARVTSPFESVIQDVQFTKQPTRNFIDQINLEQLKQLRLLPSPRSKDASFARRVFLDLIGRLPEPAETKEFLASNDPNKRDQLIDRLLSSEAYVDYWSYRWSDVFLVSSRSLRPGPMKSYYEWIRENVRRNTPWDVWVRDVLTARGDSVESGETNFYALHQDPETMAENVSQAFLSLSINCAKCHNHPLEKWTNDQYYGFANLFARVRAKGWGGDARGGDGIRTLYVEDQGDLIQPRTGKPQPPAPLDADPLDMEAPEDRRIQLAEWVASPDNPYFTRSVANRIWAALFGVGLVEPVDDLRVSNPASNEALLSALSEFLVERNYDLKALMRLILQSETYQRSSQVLPENKEDSRYFSRYYPRRLMAEILQDAIASVTDVADVYDQLQLTDGSFEKTSLYPEGTRALELYDASVASYFLNTFGRNERAITCECERSNQPSLVQVLHLSNGDAINEKLKHSGSRVQQLLAAKASPEALIDQAFLWCLCRYPSEKERASYLEIFKETESDQLRTATEDLFWALMTSREFLFQH
jgi:hypothetical protein